MTALAAINRFPSLDHSFRERLGGNKAEQLVIVGGGLGRDRQAEDAVGGRPADDLQPVLARKAAMSDILASGLNLTRANGIFARSSCAPATSKSLPLPPGSTKDCTMTRASSTAAAAQATPAGTAIGGPQAFASQD